MNWSNQLRNVLVALSLVGLGAPEAQAIEMYGEPGAAVQTSNDALTFVRAGRGGGAPRHAGGHRGGMHRPPGGMHRPPGGMHRPPGGVHRPPGGVHRPPGARPPGGVHRPPGGRPPVHRPPVHRPPMHRPPVVVRPPVVWGGRPGWYRWSPGGAVAAGAALGWMAASAATWAGPPPQAGLCWFYTDPSRRQGFWDICP